MDLTYTDRASLMRRPRNDNNVVKKQWHFVTISIMYNTKIDTKVWDIQ